MGIAWRPTWPFKVVAWGRGLLDVWITGGNSAVYGGSRGASIGSVVSLGLMPGIAQVDLRHLYSKRRRHSLDDAELPDARGYGKS